MEILDNVKDDGQVNMSLSITSSETVSLCFDGGWFMAVIKGYRKVYINPKYFY
jgi:hypothetical protein